MRYYILVCILVAAGIIILASAIIKDSEPGLLHGESCAEGGWCY